MIGRDDRSASGGAGATGAERCMVVRPASRPWAVLRAATTPVIAVSAFSLFVLAGTGNASAHVAARLEESPWATWTLTPDIVIGTLVFAGLYIAGIRRLRHKSDRMRNLRHVSFLAGVATIFLALQSPIDALGEHNFLVHQIQHILLRMLAPMLLMLAAPQAALVAGMPAWGKRRIVAPVIESNGLRGVFAALAHPVPVTVLFVAALYVWQIPRLHAAALLNDYVHYSMHATMLFAGMLFFWRVFDARPALKSTGFGTRVVMLFFVMISQIMLGSYLTLKGQVLYPVYDQIGRVGAASALADEMLGGVVVWIPSSMMAVAAMVLVIRRWGHQEEREEGRRRQHDEGREPRMTSAELRHAVAAPNRAMAFGIAALVIFTFSVAIAVGLVSELLSS